MMQKFSATLKASSARLAGSPDRAFVVHGDDDRTRRSTVLFGACPNTVKVAGGDTGGAMSLFEYAGRIPGGPPLHVHHDQDEVYFVREGAYLFEVGGARHDLVAGDTIFLPRGVPHAFAQRSATGRLLFMFTPAGSMEAYFEALGAFQGPPAPEVEAALFASHGLTLLGPPLSPA